MTEAPTPPPPPPGAGTETQPPAPPAGGGTNGLAIASLVLGILALLCLGPITGIPGVICGHMALGQIRRSGQGGRGLAIAGLVIGYIGIAWFIIFLLLGGLAALFGTASIEPAMDPGF